VKGNEDNGQVDTAYSVNGVPIRLTYERWFHKIGVRLLKLIFLCAGCAELRQALIFEF